MEKIQTQNFTNLLLILVGIMLPPGIAYLMNILNRLIFLTTNLFSGQAILISISLSFLFELVVIIGLARVLIYPIKPSNIIARISFKKFKIFGISILILYIASKFLTLVSAEQHDSALQNFLDEPTIFETIGSQLFHIELNSFLLTMVKGILLLAIYFKLINSMAKNNS